MERTVAGVARIDSIDLLRGLAALFVAWFHIFQRNDTPLSGEAWRSICQYTSAYGYLGVPAFFIISGYIIPYSTRNVHLSPANGGIYLAKRAIRLLPTLAFVSLATVALAHLATLVPIFSGPTPGYSVWNVVSNILLVAPPFGEPWILPVYWSLLVEVQYYVVIILALCLLARTHPLGWLALLTLLVVLPLFMPRESHWFGTWSACFAIGISVFLQRRNTIGTVANALIVLASSAVVVVMQGAHFLVPIVLTLAGLYNRAAVPPVMVWLGKISYSLYLVHYLVGLRTFRLLTRFGEGDWYYMLCYAGAVLASIVAAWLVFKLIEEPTMKLASSIGYYPSAAKADSAPQTAS